MLTLSVIIPTYNRIALLERVLSALAEQCQEANAEIIVVDDGSSDSTLDSIRPWAHSAAVPCTVLSQTHRGPASARNRGLEAASGSVVLFFGDDVTPAPGLVRAHVDHHQQFGEPEVAVLGRVTWSPTLRITPLMHWLEHGGPQFCYDKITDPLAVPSTFFWTANVSAKRDFVVAAGGFSERFPGAAFEDVELGVRLGHRGMRLHFEAGAVGYHHHPVTLRGSLNRMENLARGALIASDTIPGLVAMRDDGAIRRARRAVAHSRFARAFLVAVAPVLTAIPPLRAPYFRVVHDLHYRAAVRRLAKEMRWSP